MAAPGRAEEIKGQVFIVTKGGPSIKLALAQVYFLSLDDLRVMQLNAKTATAELQEKRAKMEKTVEDDVQAQYALVVKAQEGVDEKNRQYAEGSATDGNKVGTRPFKFEIQNAEAKLASTRDEVTANVAAMRKNLAQRVAIIERMVEAVVTSPPDGCAPETITDADGEFAVAIPAGKTHVMIHAAREQPAETYRWLVPVADIKRSPGKFLFSNHNLHTGGGG